MTTYEIHDYEAGVIRHTECHDSEIAAGHITRSKIAKDGHHTIERYERVEVSPEAVKAGVGWMCDTCDGSII